MHLVEVRYEDDAERRRIDYLVKKYSGDIEKASGVSLYVKNDDVMEDFLVELRSKLMEENVRVFRIESTEVELEPERRTIDMRLSRRPIVIDSFIRYFVDKRQGTVQRTLGPNHTAYRILTRKGKVEMVVEVTNGGESRISVLLKGYEPALSIIANELEKDLRHLRSGVND